MILPNKKYKILYCDPPWEYGNFTNTGPLSVEKRSKFRITPYEGMGLDEIKQLPINEITDDNAVLLLWVTYPCLQEGFQVIKAWGFEYKTVAFTWVKRNKNGIGWFFGLGNYTRANAEICLLAVKGKGIPVISKNVRQIIDLPITEHSEKPDEVRQRIIKLFGDLPRIELFARTKIFGWDVWGDDHKLELQPLEVFS